MRIQTLTFLLLSVLTGNSPAAQTFLRAGTMRPDPAAIIPDQYAVLKLPDADVDDGRINSWDSRNPYTYIELLTNQRGEVFHILYQTGFTGRMMFLGVSKNLEKSLLAREKPQLGFRECLGRINRSDPPLITSESAIDCIMRQLQRSAIPQ